MPSVKENQKSMASMADKFADKDAEDDDEDDDDASSFEEVQKPVERPSVIAAARRELKPVASDVKSTDTTFPSDAPQVSSSSSNGVSTAESPQKDEKPAKSSHTPSASTSSTSAASAAGGLREVLQEIRTMLQTQGQKIEELTSEVAQLKAKVN